MFLGSCSAESKSTPPGKSLVFKKNLNFYSGFLSGNVQIEEFDNDEFICFGDYKTHRKIVLHSLKTDLTHTIDLNQIYNRGEKILAYEITNLDTISILCYRTNTLYFINQSGEIWKQLDLNPYITPHGPYELMRSSTPFCYNDTTLIFSLSYNDPHFKYGSSKELAEYYNANYKRPKLFKIQNIYSDTLITQIGLENLYTRFTPKNHVAAEGNHFEMDENGITVISSYCDTVYKIDPVSFKIIDQKRIHSKYTNLSIQTLPIKDFFKNPSLANDNFRSDGQLREIVWDSKKHVYYCFTNHKLKNDKFPMSIIVLDKDLNQIKEFKMDETKYQFTGLVCSSGLLVSNFNETKNDSDHFEKNTYALFSYE
jgi:hypothetical protein